MGALSPSIHCLLCFDRVAMFLRLQFVQGRFIRPSQAMREWTTPRRLNSIFQPRREFAWVSLGAAGVGIKNARIRPARIKSGAGGASARTGNGSAKAEMQMLRRMKDMEGYSLSALDGFIGKVKDYYFDDARWVIRYLVVETAEWPASRKVLISPAAINRPNWSEKIMPAAITREQVMNGPRIDTDKPVSRQHEMRYLEHFSCPRYWSGPSVWGASPFPSVMLSKPGDAWSDEQYRHAEAKLGIPGTTKTLAQDAHLRSGNTVRRYQIHAADGDIGHVQAILIDERMWAIRYLVVNTSNWWVGHEVLIAPQWIEGIDWATEKVSICVTRQAIKDAPPYDPDVPLDRPAEARIHAHHSREGYWSGEAKDEPAVPHLGP
jgi:hypothetical protein